MCLWYCPAFPTRPSHLAACTCIYNISSSNVHIQRRAGTADPRAIVNLTHRIHGRAQSGACRMTPANKPVSIASQKSRFGAMSSHVVAATRMDARQRPSVACVSSHYTSGCVDNTSEDKGRKGRWDCALVSTGRTFHRRDICFTAAFHTFRSCARSVQAMCCGP